MKTVIALIGLILVLLSTHLWIYSRGLTDGKVNYQHSRNMQLTLDSAYNFGLKDGEALGYYEGFLYGQQICLKESKVKAKHATKNFKRKP
jgi:hypothetical protein